MRSHGSSLWGFRNNILQGWFKMKTTSMLYTTILSFATMGENREPEIMLYFTAEEFRRNDVITSRTCKSAFEWLKVKLRSLNIFIVSARGFLDFDWLNEKCIVLP